jgi:thioesterase domain-containing protein
MAKHMDGNPAFKRRVEDFKKLMNSSKKDEQLRVEFEKKMSMRKESKIERSRTIEMRKAKEDAMQEVIEADIQDNDVANLTAGDSGGVDKSKEVTISDNVRLLFV